VLIRCGALSGDANRQAGNQQYLQESWLQMPAEDKRLYEEKAASVLGLSLAPGVAHTPAHRVKDWTKEQVAKFVQEGWSTEEDRAKGRAYAALMLAEDIDGEGTSSPTSTSSHPTSVPNPSTPQPSIILLAEAMDYCLRLPRLRQKPWSLGAVVQALVQAVVQAVVQDLESRIYIYVQ
jgi:hypothetical protein